MSAGIYNITIEQGATFTKTITWTDALGAPVNLSGYTARAKGRRSYNASTSLFSISTGAGIVLGGALGTIVLTITDETTAAMTPGKGVWDLEVESAGGVVTRLLEGRMTVTPEATK